MANNESTSSLTLTQKILGVIGIGLLGAAHWDLSHRTPTDLRGSKIAWRVATLIPFVGSSRSRVHADDLALIS